MTSTVEQLALQAGAAKFYPEAQSVQEQNYVVSAGFLQRFHDLIREDDAKLCEKIEDENFEVNGYGCTQEIRARKDSA